MDEQNANPTEFDVIVWGATGFTGKIVVEYLHQRYGNQTDQLTWAIAGRDAGKLQAVIEAVGCDKIPCLLADGSDRASLDALVSSTRVVLSTVGRQRTSKQPLTVIRGAHRDHQSSKNQ